MDNNLRIHLNNIVRLSDDKYNIYINFQWLENQICGILFTNNWNFNLYSADIDYLYDNSIAKIKVIIDVIYSYKGELEEKLQEKIYFITNKIENIEKIFTEAKKLINKNDKNFEIGRKIKIEKKIRKLWKVVIEAENSLLKMF